MVIPFGYKQSALYQPFTLLAIDSVINILLKHDSVTLTINGYAHADEGTDSICYYLSLNRALAIKDYVLGRGVDSSRIFSLKGWGNFRSFNRKTNNEILKYNCRAEIMLNYPLPPPPPLFLDKDEDGIADSDDKCPDEFGEQVNGGCPVKDVIVVPFDVQQSALNTITYKVLDSVIAIMLKDPTISIAINGHAYKKEGNKTVCDRLANERADIVKNYLLSRRINGPRIISVKSSGYAHPITAGRNPAEIARNSRAEIFLVHP